jgi:hypothetical protein
MIVAGACVLLLGLVTLGGGAALLAIHATQRDSAGFYASGSNPIATPTHALVAEGLEVGTDGPGWLFRKGRLGTLRVTATGTAGKPVFVGIAPRDRVAEYLDGVAYDEIRDLELDPFSVTTRRHPGTAVPAPPTSRAMWSASASGAGDQSAKWQVQRRDWAVVLMNADGTPGVATNVAVAAKVEFLPWLGAGLTVLGVMLGAGGAVMIAAAGGRLRRASPDPDTAAPVGAPASP